jgi:hypothetical protein
MESRAAEGFGAGLFLLHAVVLLRRSAPPSMTDYANWTYQGVLLARHLKGIPDAAHVLKAYPVPNSAATLGIGLLALGLPWAIAAKVWLCVQMGLTFWAIRHLARTVGASGAVWWIVPQTAFLGLNWWYGFVNFELGLAWVLLMASMLLRRVRGEPDSDWPLGVMLVLAFFTHMIPFAFCGLLVMLYAWQTGRWRVVWQVVPSATLTLWYLGGRFLQAGNADGQAGMIETVRDYSAAFWAYKANSYFKSFGFVNPSGPLGSVALTLMGRWAFVALIGVDLLLAGLLGLLMVPRALEVFRGKAPERFLWVGMLVFLPVFLLAPGTALGVSDPGSRLLQTVLVLGILLVCRGARRVLGAASVCGAMLSVAGLLVFARIQLGPPVPASFSGLPRAVVSFAHVPFDDQDYFYGALERGDYGQIVFPTGMFLNRSRK